MKRSLLLAVLLASACGGSRPAPDHAPGAAGSGGSDGSDGSDGSGSASPAESCPQYIDCMPPTDGPCPPPGFKERCPDTQITY